MNVVCVGDCGIDHYLPSGEKRVGGISGNFARHARRQFNTDDVVQLISVVGDDDDARIVRTTLDQSGVECFIQSQSGSTPVQYIELRPDGEREFVRYEEGVLSVFHLGAMEESLVSDSDLLVVPVYLQIVGLFEKLMAIPSRGITSVDFADFLQHPDFSLLDTHIDNIDIGFFGLTADDTSMISEISKRAAARNKLFIVTLGANGSIAFHGSKEVRCAATTVESVLDTTGAGDAFAAGFLSQHCHGVNIPDAMSAGASLAAAVIQVQGATLPAV